MPRSSSVGAESDTPGGGGGGGGGYSLNPTPVPNPKPSTLGCKRLEQVETGFRV